MIPTIVSSGNGAGALATGLRILRRGGSALDAVEACARVVEADPSDTTVGRGGHPNILGQVELDAFADANELASPGTRLNIVVLARDGTHAAASSRTSATYAFMTAEMIEAATEPRLAVPRRAARR